MRLYPCGNFFLSLPDDHKLPEIQQHHVMYDRGYSSIVRAIAEWRPNGALVDIGANVGDTAAFFRTHANNPIICVEGGDNFLAHLRHNINTIGSEKIYIVDKFVSTNNGGNISASYIEDKGTGRLLLNEGSSIDLITTSNVIEFSRSVSNGEIAIVKTDTDGMDALIVRDILDNSPDFALHFECDYRLTQSLGKSDLWKSIFDDLLLKRWAVIIFDNHGLPMIFMDEISPNILENIQGWIHLQHQIGLVRTHYIDIFAFPPNAIEAYRSSKMSIGDQLLKPYAY